MRTRHRTPNSTWTWSFFSAQNCWECMHYTDKYSRVEPHNRFPLWWALLVLSAVLSVSIISIAQGAGSPLPCWGLLWCRIKCSERLLPWKWCISFPSSTSPLAILKYYVYSYILSISPLNSSFLKTIQSLFEKTLLFWFMVWCWPECEALWGKMYDGNFWENKTKQANNNMNVKK